MYWELHPRMLISYRSYHLGRLFDIVRFKGRKFEFQLGFEPMQGLLIAGQTLLPLSH